jgi:co-chaperonin GroES (HSP10)
MSDKVINENGVMVAKSALTWVSEEEIPDPKGITVLGEKIMVRPIEISKKMKSKTSNFELILPDTVKESAQVLLQIGRVVAVGEHAGKRSGVSQLMPGDHIVFPKMSGDRVTIQGVKVVFMYDDVPLAKVDPENIDLSVT